MPRVSNKRQVASVEPIGIDADWDFLRAPINPVTAMSGFLDDLQDMGPDGGKALDEMEGLGHPLKSLRIEADGGDGGARTEIAEIRAEIDERVSQDEFPFAGLVLVASLLTHAGIAVGEAIPAATGRLVAAEDAADLLEIFYKDAVANLLDEVDDWIEVAEAAMTAAAVFPADLKSRLVDLITGDAEPRRAVLAIGFLLHRDDEPAFAAIRGVAGRADLDAENRRRIAVVRPWLSPVRREAADAAFGPLPEAAIWATQTASKGTAGRKLTLIASVCDASGASGLYATQSLARRHSGAAIMVKPSGVVDVQFLRGLRLQEMRNFENAVAQAAPCARVDAATFARLLGQALGRNLEAGAPPPVGLVQVLEVLGFDGIRPETVSAAEVLEDLLADRPDRDEPAVIAAAQARATATAFAEEWRCSPVDVETVADGARTPKQLAARVLGLLPAQGDFWMRNCAVSAAVLKAGGDPMWKTLALVGRDIGRGVPLADMPLMRRIAENSARAYWEVRPRPPRRRAS